MDFTQISKILHQNIAIAVGCTEPVAVALAVTKAKETLNLPVEKVELWLSRNIIKNAMGVGIPGTDMIGLPIAVALGIVCGDSRQELQVLANARLHVEEAKQWLEEHKIEINLKNTNEKLYIEAVCFDKTETKYAKAIISKQHTNFVLIEKNGEKLVEKNISSVQNEGENEGQQGLLLQELNARLVYDYATTASIEDLQWILDTAKVNEAMVDEGLHGNYGLHSGLLLSKDSGLNLRKKIIAHTCAASDARMGGATLPIYSNFGSGNQGITCTIPVYEFGLELNCSEEKIIRALILSNLMSIYIKSRIGRLSALCGIVNASIGVTSAIVYLENGSFEQICFAIRNMINTITGMICDGAKPSCALKISTGLNAAFDSELLAMHNVVVDETDGIASKYIEKAIENIGKIGRYGMDETDELILDIMTHNQ
ncbi:MAG: L-serine ammonia-lyase, iron-sulfur-dependent, subunit alpha [Bacteroidales bacterium]|jgi:L-cysteine desulfidase|nr:L-serine ammonia-lyase, iron-sulfur-dependent, subunit alpha [Bacteroidales bacterium]